MYQKKQQQQKKKKIKDWNDLFVAVGTGLLLSDDAPAANAKLVKSGKNIFKILTTHKIHEKRNKNHVWEAP